MKKMTDEMLLDLLKEGNIKKVDIKSVKDLTTFLIEEEKRKQFKGMFEQNRVPKLEYKENKVKISSNTSDALTHKVETILNEIRNIIVKKNKDYGSSFKTTVDKYGRTVYAIRLNDKINRFEQLLKTSGEVKDESIEDTLKDLIGYATLILIDMEERNGKCND